MGLVNEGEGSGMVKFEVTVYDGIITAIASDTSTAMLL